MRLNHIVPWGRNFDEYSRMFHLDDEDRSGTILGCGDGPASFNAEATALGYQVISCDPLYVFAGDAIAASVAAGRDDIKAQLEHDRESYLWTDFTSPEQVIQVRQQAMIRFFTDYAEGRQNGRYLAAELPHLPFRKNHFDVALCSHLLFLYSDQLSFDFHRAALNELSRVACEVRIFPLVDLEGRCSQHLEPLLKWLDENGLEGQVEPVSYHFQKGANSMLRVRHR